MSDFPAATEFQQLEKIVEYAKGINPTSDKFGSENRQWLLQYRPLLQKVFMSCMDSGDEYDLFKIHQKQREEAQQAAQKAHTQQKSQKPQTDAIPNRENPLFKLCCLGLERLPFAYTEALVYHLAAAEQHEAAAGLIKKLTEQHKTRPADATEACLMAIRLAKDEFLGNTPYQKSKRACYNFQQGAAHYLGAICYNPEYLPHAGEMIFSFVERAKEVNDIDCAAGLLGFAMHLGRKHNDAELARIADEAFTPINNERVRRGGIKQPDIPKNRLRNPYGDTPRF